MDVYEARHAGREYCNQTEGSDHYKEGGIEPMDLIIAKGFARHFCLANIIKYATRFDETNNLADLRKVSDYAQILCGVELEKATPAETKVEPWGRKDINRLSEICVDLECTACPLYSSNNEGTEWCSDYFKNHPAEARVLMDKWEAENGSKG